MFESGGSIVDALKAAAYAALRDTRLPKLNLIVSDEDIGDADIEV